MRNALAVIATVALALGCGGKHSGFPPSSQLAQMCNGASPQKAWIRSYMDEVYLWYSEIPLRDPNAYPTPPAYFEALKVTTLTASGRPRDRFSFTYDTAAWNALASSGVELGYGIDWTIVPQSRIIHVAYLDPNTPATAPGTGIARGALLQKVNGQDVNTMARDVLVEALFPSVAATVTFDLLEVGAIASHQVSLTSTSITHQPVLIANVLTTPNGPVGYLLFNQHLGAAESELIAAIKKFQTAAVSDVILDMRYNGGGYLSIASRLGYMLGGSRVQGQPFETLQFNDKQQSSNSTERFLATDSQNNPLPTLNLPRVFILSTASTCSASEAVINGLAPFVQVVRLGTTTCGKPYGFLPQDNCGTTYFAIQFQSVNAAGQGGYADGIAPECTASDDLNHALGDPAENLLSAALSRRANGTCPPASFALPRTADDVSRPEPVLLRTPAREASILDR